MLVCTHATFRFAVDKFGVEAFDDRLIAVDEFHHVSANPDNKLGLHLGQFIARDQVHIVAMTGSYFRGDAEAVLTPQDEAKFDTVTYTYYEQLNGYEYLKQLDIGYFFYSGSYADDILKVLDPAEKTIIHIPNVNSRESTKDKIKEVEHIIEALGEWQGTDPATGFQLVKTPDGRVLRIADLVDDDSSQARPGFRRAERPGAEEQPRPRGHHHRPWHGEGRLRLDLVRARADGRLSVEPDRDRADHRPRDPRRAGQDSRALHQPDRRAGCLRGGRHRGRQRHPEGHRRQPADGAGACAALRVQAEESESGPTPGFDYGEGGYDPNKCNVGFNEETGQFQIEIKGLAEPKSKEAARICQRGLERGDCRLRSGQDRHRTRPV